jgi:hypothetical protein
MPLYYFDIHDGERLTRDEIGLALSDGRAARDAAIEALPEIARHALLNVNQRKYTVTVRNERGRTVVRATLTFKSEWVDSMDDRQATAQVLQFGTVKRDIGDGNDSDD